jgi:hypothetical protein
MTTQFPPSSPLLAHTDHHDDPFNSSGSPKKLIISTPFNRDTHTKNREETYPTPNPSSSAGNRESSPTRVESYNPVRSEIDLECVKDNEDSHRIVNRQKALKVLLYPNEKVTLGRSSRCDYFMKSRFASRLHVKLQYNKEKDELTVLCKGNNKVHIQFTEKKYGRVLCLEENVYLFEQKEPSECGPDESFEELEVACGEQFTVPYSPSLSLRVMDYEVVVDVTSDESETEDEIPVLKKRLSSIEPTEQMKEVEPDHLQTPIDKPTRPVESTAPVRQLSQGSTPILKSSESLTENKPSDCFKSVEPEGKITTETHERSKSFEIKKERLVLHQKSSNDLNKEMMEKMRRTRKAEPGLSPIKKRPERLQPRQKIEAMNIEKILSTIDKVEPIKNVLTNHLAFSRLSQTPLKQLQTVSALTQKLSREQLRAVLADTPHIGVIYRHGKDAAGKHLDEEYYYDVENDNDKERVNLVNTMKGGGLRNCRKTHKQYFWKKPGTTKK